MKDERSHNQPQSTVNNLLYPGTLELRSAEDPTAVHLFVIIIHLLALDVLS